MSTTHFVLRTTDTRTHLTSRHAYRRGEASWRFDEAAQVPRRAGRGVDWWEWQTPINGPFPAFGAERLPQIVEWLTSRGYTAVVIEEPT